MNEKLIKNHMETLGLSREEAIQLIQEDEEVNRMTSTKEIDSDLTEEQRKTVKKARQSSRKPTVYKFDTSKRERKPNQAKRDLIECLRTAVEQNGCSDIEVTNIEREIIFFKDGTKFKIVLSAPRK